ncbi:MAG: LamG domain-containing protein [Chloroflexi bacterium]|nr:LamG domain-containing protein [Chloroflexota bacterium]
MKVRRDFIYDPGLVLYLPFYQSDGAAFKSKDSYGHLATVSGASWRPGGRYFDGVDDNIALPATPVLSPTLGTILLWIRFGRSGTAEYLYSQNIDNWSVYHNGEDIRLYYDQILVAGWARVVGVDTWVHLAFTFGTGETGRGYEDAVEKASGACSTSNPTEGLIKIGSLSNGATPFLGDIGEFYLYNRMLSSVEILYHYLATKWRYR